MALSFFSQMVIWYTKVSSEACYYHLCTGDKQIRLVNKSLSQICLFATDLKKVQCVKYFFSFRVVLTNSCVRTLCYCQNCWTFAVQTQDKTKTLKRIKVFFVFVKINAAQNEWMGHETLFCQQPIHQHTAEQIHIKRQPTLTIGHFGKYGSYLEESKKKRMS